MKWGVFLWSTVAFAQPYKEPLNDTEWHRFHNQGIKAWRVRCFSKGTFKWGALKGQSYVNIRTLIPYLLGPEELCDQVLNYVMVYVQSPSVSHPSQYDACFCSEDAPYPPPSNEQSFCTPDKMP